MTTYAVEVTQWTVTVDATAVVVSQSAPVVTPLIGTYTDGPDAVLAANAFNDPSGPQTVVAGAPGYVQPKPLLTTFGLGHGYIASRGVAFVIQ